MNNLPNNKNTLETLKFCCEALLNKKAEDMIVLDVRDKSNLTDYFIIASGTSDPHLKALQGSLKDALKDHKMKNVKIDYEPGSGWVAIDLFDIVIHVFLKEKRDYYRLDLIWKDADTIDITTL